MKDVHKMAQIKDNNPMICVHNTVRSVCKHKSVRYRQYSAIVG